MGTTGGFCWVVLAGGWEGITQAHPGGQFHGLYLLEEEEGSGGEGEEHRKWRKSTVGFPDPISAFPLILPHPSLSYAILTLPILQTHRISFHMWPSS